MGPNQSTAGALSSWNAAHANQNCANTAPARRRGALLLLRALISGQLRRSCAMGGTPVPIRADALFAMARQCHSECRDIARQHMARAVSAIDRRREK